MKNKKNIIINAIALVVLILLVYALSPKAMQNDTFWSIKVGEKLVKEGVFGIDNFSMHEGLYYIAHHFLTDVLIYLIFSILNFTGLYLFEIILGIIISILLFMLNYETINNKYVSYFMTAVQLVLIKPNIAVRAQMISYILFIIELVLLEKFSKNEKKKYVVGLAIIPILLANFHMGAVPFFFILLAVNIIRYIKIKFLCFETVEKTDKSRIKKLALVLLIGVCTVFINPYGIDGVIYPFKTFGNAFINSSIHEFQPYTMYYYDGLGLFYIFSVMLIYIINKKNIKINDFLLIMGTLFMSLTAIRYVCFFVICSYVTLRYLKDNKEIYTNGKFFKENIIALRRTVFIVLIFFVIVQKVDSIISDNDVYYIPPNAYPVEAKEKLKDYITADTKLFNEYAWGSYLMLNNINVFIDSRCDLYTEEYNNTQIATDYKKLINCDKDYEQIIEKYDLNTFIIISNSHLTTLLNADSNYINVYSDKTATIFVKK